MQDEDAVRYTKLEAKVASVLGERVSSLEQNVGNLIASIEKLNSSFDRLVSKVNIGTPWTMLASWSAVIITVVAGTGWLVVSPIESRLVSLGQQINRIEREIVTHYRDGHPLRVEKAMESLNNRVRDIERSRKSAADDPQWERIRALERAVFGKVEPERKN